MKNIDHIETKTTSIGTLRYQGNSQLLMDYRDALIKAFELGEDIKIIYGIVPPNVLFDRYTQERFTGTVNLKLCVARNVNKQDQN